MHSVEKCCSKGRRNGFDARPAETLPKAYRKRKKKEFYFAYLVYIASTVEWVFNTYRQFSNISRTLLGNLNCWSLRCSWSIACQHCSNYIFILHLTVGFNALRKDNCMPRPGISKFWDLVPLILEILRYIKDWKCMDAYSPLVQVMAWRRTSSKPLPGQWCILSTVTTADRVLKHPSIRIHNADSDFPVLDQFHTKITFTAKKLKLHLWQNEPVVNTSKRVTQHGFLLCCSVYFVDRSISRRTLVYSNVVPGREFIKYVYPTYPLKDSVLQSYTISSNTAKYRWECQRI